MEETPPINIETLPANVISHVMNYLTEQDIIPTALTCHSFRNIINESRSLVRSIARPILHLRSDVATPLITQDEFATVATQQENYAESKRRIQVAKGRMRWGGHEAQVQQADFKSWGKVKHITTNTEMDKVLVYFKGGHTRIYPLETFQNVEQPLTTFQGPSHAKKITFLNHSVAIGKTNYNDGTACFLFDSTCGQLYGRLKYSDQRNYLSLAINESFAAIMTQIPGAKINSYVLEFYGALPKNSSNHQSHPSPGPFFTQLYVHMRLNAFTDFLLDGRRLCVYDQPTLNVFILDKPEEIVRKREQQEEEEEAAAAVAAAGNVVDLETGEAGEVGHVNLRGGSIEFHPFLEMAREFHNSPTTISSDSDDDAQRERSVTPLYERVFLMNPIEKHKVRPSHSIRPSESTKLYGDLVIGSWDDEPALFHHRQTDRGSDRNFLVHFKHCSCNCCVVGVVPGAKLRTTTVHELSRGFGFFVGHENFVKLFRFDTSF